MPKRGTCKLCQKPALLQDSHLIGRAMYKMSRQEKLAPVVMTPELATHTSKQIHEYVFCVNCEDVFNKGGEKYVTELVFNGDSFPLLEKMKLGSLAGRKMNRQGLLRFSGKTLGINTDKLAHYAIGMVWRASVHTWKTLGQQTTSVVLDGKRKEEFRRYLLGHTALPRHVGVVVTVCSDLGSQGMVFAPTLSKGSQFTTYGILVRGIYFRVLIDVPGRFPLQDVCCVHSEDNVIWVEDCSAQTKHSFDALNEYAKVTRNLKRSA